MRLHRRQRQPRQFGNAQAAAIQHLHDQGQAQAFAALWSLRRRRQHRFQIVARQNLGQRPARLGRGDGLGGIVAADAFGIEKAIELAQRRQLARLGRCRQA